MFSFLIEWWYEGMDCGSVGFTGDFYDWFWVVVSICRSETISASDKLDADYCY